MKYIRFFLSLVLALFMISPLGSLRVFADAPNIPTNFRAISGNERVFLSWDSNDNSNDLLGYKIYISGDLGDSFESLIGITGEVLPNHYEVIGLENGNEYIFGISAYNESLEESEMIKSITVIPADTSSTDLISPEDISSLSVIALDSKVTLSWTGSLDTQNDLVGYKLYISDDFGQSFDEGKDIGYVTTHTESDLENNKTYVFKITAYDEVPNENTGVISDEVMPVSGGSNTNENGIEFGDNPPTTNTFTDVDNSNVFKSYIEYLAARNIINGYDDGIFLPNKKLTRGEAVKIILVAIGVTNLSSVEESTFSDVSPQNALAPYIEEAYFFNIVKGYGDSTFRPDVPVLRKEFSKMFLEAIQGTLTNPVPNAYFIDVPLDHTFARWIYSAYKKGYLSGYEDSTFRPNYEITRAEASKIVASYLQGETLELPQNSNLELHLLSLINSSRIDYSLPTLTIDRELSIVAKNHAEDLYKNIKSPSSIGSDGKDLFDRLEDAGINYDEASENIAKVDISDRTSYKAVEDLHLAIMSLDDNQPNQKANILSTYKNFEFIGIGIEEDENSDYIYIVVDFNSV